MRYVILDGNTGEVMGRPPLNTFSTRMVPRAMVVPVQAFALWAGLPWNYVVAVEKDEGVYLALPEPPPPIEEEEGDEEAG